WTQIYNNGGGDEAYYITTDNSGYIYVTGSSYNGTDFDFATIKYDPAGNSIWTQRMNSVVVNSNDYGHAVCVDNSGCVYVTGPRQNWNYFTIKYSSNGNTMWSQQGPSGRTFDIDVDNNNGFVYITGFRDVGNYDNCTIKYTTNGISIWTQQYDGGFNNDDRGHGLVVDNTGYIYVTGHKYNGVNVDYFTIKYQENGATIWTQQYDGGGIDWSRGIAMDSLGYIYITGFTHNGSDYDFFTIKYDSNGNTLWTQQYDGGDTDAPERIAVDQMGSVYVAGYRYNGTDDDFFVIKYMQPPYPQAPVSMQFTTLSESSVFLQWTDDSINEEGFKIYKSEDGTNFIFLLTTNTNEVTYQDNNIVKGKLYWYRIIATNRAGAIISSAFQYDTLSSILSTLPTGVYPNYLKLQQRGETRIVIGEPDTAQIKIYNMANVLIKQFTSRYFQKGDYVVWDGTNESGDRVASGIYFVLIEGENINKKLKMIIKK
ncbi:MAG: SBBP repeat-containing protein, partial [Spirochaetes bacterium]|nr:SBBP repeat-containing protein [Spirochaetota bacterium]